jgi:hypothetical protein
VTLPFQVGSLSRKSSFSEVLGEREKPKSYHSCAVSAKEPRLLVKELQRMFGENKLLLRASGASFVKGDKNKTRFDIVIYKVRGVSVFMISFVQEPCLVVIFFDCGARCWPAME